MEEEIHYSSVVFKNSGTTPKDNKEDPACHSKVNLKGAATTVPDGEAVPRSHSYVLAVCLGILCVLLVVSLSVIIYIIVVMNQQKANLSDLTAENQQLIMERSILERRTKELSRETYNLTWMLDVILKFKTFNVNDYCPNKKCQPCQTGWIQFKEKCYLFYNENNPWTTWQVSQENCKKTAADLVVIDSQQEQEFISNHTAYYYDMFHGYWIGLHKMNDKNWVWVDGRDDILGYWISGTFGDSGKCGLMIPGKNLTASWDPADCTMLNKFICESDVLVRAN